MRRCRSFIPRTLAPTLAIAAPSHAASDGSPPSPPSPSLIATTRRAPCRYRRVPRRLLVSTRVAPDDVAPVWGQGHGRVGVAMTGHRNTRVRAVVVGGVGAGQGW